MSPQYRVPTGKELDILCGIPLGSILGPPLFDIDICDFVFIDMSSDIANYADDTTPYECDPYYEKFTKYLTGPSIIILKLMLLLNVIFSYRPISLLP